MNLDGFPSQGYQFWTQTDEKGGFEIRGVREGTYNLYAWVPGIIGDFKHDVDVIIEPGMHDVPLLHFHIYDAVKPLNAHTFLPGGENHVGDLVHKPPRNGPTMWEIGIPDRTAAEFYVPDPDPQLINKLYINSKQK